MKKILLALFALAFFGNFVAFAHAQTGAASEKGWVLTHDVQRFLGTYVMDRDDLRIAKVRALVPDREGRLAFAILSLRGQSGREEWVAVPYSLLTYKADIDEFATNLTQDHLASAPRVHDLAELSGHEDAGKVYRYFGVQPSWESEEFSIEMGE